MKPFLTAEWRHLLMLNYAIDPAVLRPRLPSGLELDTWNGTTYVSMVGFMFLRTRVMGIAFPWHTNFEEVNLRFYVRRKVGSEWRRGVVFVREIVPRTAIATVARICYNEPYLSLPMRHHLDLENGVPKVGSIVEYSWRHLRRWHRIRATVNGRPKMISPGSEEEFITEHYWGYTKQPNGNCAEYAVEHPRWLTMPVTGAVLECDIEGLYGKPFSEALATKPVSSFVAHGSEIRVLKRRCN